jgi:hypothetical protein
MIFDNKRNNYLQLSDSELLKQCTFVEYQASGPGGQKRNRKYSGARLTHTPTGLQVTCAESRSLNQNKNSALKKLKIKIVLTVRSDENFDKVPDFSVSQKNPQYPVLLAAVFDTLYQSDFAVSEAAEKLSISTSKLIRFLASNPAAWQIVNQERKARNLKTLNSGR